jgi:Uncharacterized protein conserved in bacteria
MRVGAQRYALYLPYLENKNVAIVANQTSMVDTSHLVDFLIAKGIKLEKVFSPEHGFRGNADAGAYVNNSTDAKTGLPLVSLYGKNKNQVQRN